MPDVAPVTRQTLPPIDLLSLIVAPSGIGSQTAIAERHEEHSSRQSPQMNAGKGRSEVGLSTRGPTSSDDLLQKEQRGPARWPAFRLFGLLDSSWQQFLRQRGLSGANVGVSDPRLNAKPRPDSPGPAPRTPSSQPGQA